MNGTDPTESKMPRRVKVPQEPLESTAYGFLVEPYEGIAKPGRRDAVALLEEARRLTDIIRRGDRARTQLEQVRRDMHGLYCTVRVGSSASDICGRPIDSFGMCVEHSDEYCSLPRPPSDDDEYAESCSYERLSSFSAKVRSDREHEELRAYYLRKEIRAAKRLSDKEELARRSRLPGHITNTTAPRYGCPGWVEEEDRALDGNEVSPQ